MSELKYKTWTEVIYSSDLPILNMAQYLISFDGKAFFLQKYFQIPNNMFPFTKLISCNNKTVARKTVIYDGK